MSNLVGEILLRLAKVAAATVVGVVVYAILVGPLGVAGSRRARPPLVALGGGVHPARREQPDLTPGPPGPLIVTGEAGFAQAQAVVRILRDVVAADLLGAYLYGSAIAGGLRPRSDVDVLAVVRQPLTDGQRRAIVDRLFDISGSRARRGPARPVELTVVVASEVRPWRYPPQRELQYGEWLRADLEAGAIPGPRPDPDLATLLTMVLAQGRPLHGPVAAALLDPVPPGDLRRAIAEGVPGLMLDLESDTANVLLTLARIWLTLATGQIASKDAAADWALSRLPAAGRPAVARARSVYLGGADDSWAGIEPDIRAAAGRLTSEIEDAVRGSSEAPG